jgi:hypothetical protein
MKAWYLVQKRKEILWLREKHNLGAKKKFFVRDQEG